MADITNEKNETLDLNEILKVRRDKLAALQKEGRDPFSITKFEVTNHTREIIDEFEDYENKTVSIAGRIMSKRGMGKASFSDILDRTGKIQLYMRVNELGKEQYENVKKLDIGDIVGVTGEVFKTNRGEVSIKVEKITLLSKSLLPLPEKFHGSRIQTSL